MSGYPYTPLGSERREIRLLMLRPGEPASPIRCDLLQANLDASPSYTALSYTWGDTSVTKCISIGGQEALVTENLESALQHLRNPTCTVTLWVDAICVNQADPEERSSQVQLMRWIFGDASAVVIWLGPAQHDSDLGIAFANTIAESKDDAEICNLLTNPFYRSALKALRNILRRPWWDRVWVIQEAVAGNSERVIHCGSSSVMLSTFTIALHRLIDYTLRKGTPGSADLAPPLEIGFRSALVLEQIRRYLQTKADGMDLFYLLTNLRYFQASDHRDKIYALLGIATNVGSIIPDYTKSVIQVYKEAVKHCIEQDQSLRVLCLSRSVRNYELPSWVPDWSCKQQEFPRLLAQPSASIRKGDKSRKSLVTAHFSVDLDVLYVTGVLCDTLCTVIEAVQGSGGMEKWISRSVWTKGLREYVNHKAEKDGPYNGVDGTIEAFWRTIIANSSTDMVSPAPAEYGHMFQVLVNESDVPNNFQPNQVRSEEDRVRRALNYILPFMSCMARSLDDRRFFWSQRGYMGLAPPSAQVGDKVCVLVGCGIPFILREKTSYYQFVGESYVHGIMNGEIMEHVEEGKLALQEFEIR